MHQYLAYRDVGKGRKQDPNALYAFFCAQPIDQDLNIGLKFSGICYTSYTLKPSVAK